MYSDTGKAVSVADADISRALEAGYRVKSGEIFKAIDPESGKTFDIANQQDLFDVSKAGWSFETPEQTRKRETQMEFGEDEWTAAGAGALRGATFGASDVALTELGVEERTLAGLKEASPMASMAGEFAGIGASLFIPGSPVARVSQIGMKAGAGVKGALLATKGVEAGMLARAAATGTGFAAAGALEGVAYGAGAGVSEVALTEDDLWNPEGAAEIIGNKIVEGAIFGGVAGGALGLGGSLAASSVKKGAVGLGNLAERAAKKLNLPSHAGDIYGKQLAKTFPGLDPKKMAPEAMDQFKNILHDSTLLPDGPIMKGKAGEIIDRLGQANVRNNEVLSSFYGSLDDVIKQIPGGESLNPSVSGIRESLQGRIDDLERLAGKTDQAHVKEIRKYLQKIDQIPEGKTTDTLLDFGFDDPARRVSITELAKQIASVGKKSPAAREVSEALVRELDDVAETVIGKADALIPEEAVSAFRVAKDASSVLEKAMLATNKKKVVTSLSDQFKKMGFAMTQMTATSMAFGVPLSRAMLGAGVRAGIHGLGRISRGRLNTGRTYQALHEMSTLDGMRKYIDKIENGTQKTVDAVGSWGTKGRKFTTPVSYNILKELTGKKDDQVAAKEVIDKIAQVSTNPELMADSISASLKSIEGSAPQTAEQTAILVTQQLQQLQQLMPKQLQEKTLQPLLADKHISKAELQQFKEALAVALRPDDVIKQIGNGHITPGMMQAIKLFYPKRYEVLKQSLAMKASELKKKLPNSTIAQLGVIFGESLDPSLNPDTIARNQEMYTQQVLQSQEAIKQAPGKQLSKSEIEGFTGNLESQSQRMDGGIK